MTILVGCVKIQRCGHNLETRHHDVKGTTYCLYIPDLVGPVCPPTDSVVFRTCLQVVSSALWPITELYLMSGVPCAGFPHWCNRRSLSEDGFHTGEMMLCWGLAEQA